MREQLLNILTETIPGVDFEAGTSLVDSGVLESLDIISVVTELMDVFNVEITVDDLTPENFNTVDSILHLIESKRD